MIVVFKVFQIMLFHTSLFVGANSWKTCQETFCGRVRQASPENIQYLVDWGTVRTDSRNAVLAEIITDVASKPLTLDLMLTTTSIFHLQINEKYPTVPRFRVFDVISGDQDYAPTTVTVTSTEAIIEGVNCKAILYGAPFKVEFYTNDVLVSVFNAQDRMVFETKTKNTAVAIDVSFPGTQHAYGIPLHADRLSLQNTSTEDPYRLYNVDNNYYTVKSTEALYGTVPVLYAHGTNHSTGVFWHNSAQTWVDIASTSDQVDTYFMGEGGLLDMFVLMGPTLQQAVKQYVTLTRTGSFPQYFTLGYHQSRNYMSSEEVLDVVKNFDQHNLPLDAVWLDIDYTEDRKFFTWAPRRFPQPVKLQAQLAATKRKLFALINPHIKAEEGYFFHDVAAAKGYYVHNSNYSDFMGNSPSGRSGFFDPLTGYNFYMNLFSMAAFNGKNIHIWHDMNEPAVFDNPDHENTLPSGLRHGRPDFHPWMHGDLHNMYGFFQTHNTYFGLLKRRINARPFILTRSHFAANQNYAAVWTGRTNATWEYLEISFPMCLSEALAGISFCGADVGGFGGIPDDELYQRWYQAGAWLPLYRGHSSDDVPRREPYLYSSEIKTRVRAALNQRYAHLPVWYTLFWEHNKFKDPVIRPITYQYPKEEEALTIDSEILVGANILAAPVLKQSVTKVLLYLPGGPNEIWYNIDDNYRIMFGTGYQLLHVDLNSVPVFYRGGSIIPRKDKRRRSSGVTRNDPYTLYVCLDKNQHAEGTLYADDYESFNYKLLKYLYVGFSFANNTLSSYKIDVHADYEGAADIGQIIVLGSLRNITWARVLNQKVRAEIILTNNSDGTVLIVNNLQLGVGQPFKLELY